MDVYEQSLINVLMPDGAPASWQESEEFSPYIQRLASCGLAKLSSECDSLKEEQATVLEQTKELAYKEYFTFIHAADCSKSMGTQLGALESQLSRTCDGVSSLHASLDRFVNTSRSLLAARQLNTTTLSKHTQLLEILELSQLLDTCVRNSYHDEALEIIAYVRRLEKRHGHIPIIKSIVSEVQASSQQMLSQLLAQLRTDTNLPQCLKVVGLIRTLDVFTECQLRIKFLHTRDAWLTSSLAAIPQHDPYQHLSKSVECARVHLFDIVTQYRAIFSDDDLRVPSLQDQDTDLPALLQTWILHKVSGVLQTLRRGLRRGGVSGSSLESLLAQCMFFGQSLSRIGADFRSLLPEIFQEAAARQLERDVRTANHKFDEGLSAFSLMDACPVLGLHSATSFATGSGAGRPPLSLLEFPPLGHYLNSLVTAFNTLRLCCFPALLPRLVTLLTASLDKVVRSLLELHQAESSGFSGAEEAAFSRLCSSLKGALLPHLNTVCLRALFPLSLMAQLTGCSVLVLAKTNFGQLDIAKICEPLEPFLPTPQATEELDNDINTVEQAPQLAAAAQPDATSTQSAEVASLDDSQSTGDEILDTYPMIPDLSAISNDGGSEELIAKSAAIQPTAGPGDLTFEMKGEPNEDASIACDSSASAVNAAKSTSLTSINRPSGEQVGSAGTSSAVVPQDSEPRTQPLSSTVISPVSGFGKVEDLFENPVSHLSQRGLVDLNFTSTVVSVSQDSNVGRNETTNVSPMPEVTGVEDHLTEIKLND